MVNYSPSARSSVIAVIVTLVLLLFIFTAPPLIMKNISAKVIPKTQATVEALFREEWDTAIAEIDDVARLLEEREKTLMLFMDHHLVDELITAAKGCQHLARVHDRGQVFVELEFILNRMHYLSESESFTLGNLL